MNGAHRLSLLGFLILAWGCHPIEGPSNRPGGLTIHFQTPSRTVVASFDAVSRFEVFLVHSETGESLSLDSGEGSTSVEVANLAAGTWTMDVAALSASNQTLAVGSTSVYLSGGQSQNVTVHLSATQKGSGGFSFAFALPEGLGVESVRARLVSGNTELGKLDLVRGNGLLLDSQNNRLFAKLTSSDFGGNGTIASGTYLLLLDFLSGGGLVLGSHGEAVNVWDNVVSEAWLGADGKLYSQRVFSATDLASSSSVPESLKLTYDDGETVAYSTSVFQYVLASGKLSITLLGSSDVPGQLLEYAVNGGSATTVPWSTSTTIGLSGVQRLRIRITAPNRQTFVDYVLGAAQSGTLKDVDFSPAGLTGDQYGNLYIVDRGDPSNSLGGRIIKMNALGDTEVFAGDGLVGGDDGGPTTASFSTPYGIARDDAGNLYVAEALSSTDGRIRKVSPSGTVTTLVPSGLGLRQASGVAVTRDGATLYLADRGNGRIVAIDGVTGAIGTTVIAGLSNPDAVALSPDETYIAIGANGDQSVRKVILATQAASLMAQTGQYTYGVTIDADGFIYCCLVLGHRIIKITAENVFSDVIGSGTVGQDDGIGPSATLNDPWQIYRSPYTGVFYFTERGSKKIRTFQ